MFIHPTNVQPRLISNGKHDPQKTLPSSNPSNKTTCPKQLIRKDNFVLFSHHPKTSTQPKQQPPSHFCQHRLSQQRKTSDLQSAAQSTPSSLDLLSHSLSLFFFSKTINHLERCLLRMVASSYP